MAIVQISRITHRKGLSENLPQLAGAEFGWATNTRKLYIGNGTLSEGAPVIGNTEVLTEFSDILNLASTYTYKGAAAGYTVQTGPTSNQPVTRTLQSKLDDMASVKDFGAVGDGVTDDTLAINRALYELFCREANTEVRRSLFFPAGTYLISETIIIPTYAKIYGEGSQGSIIKLDVSSDFSTLNAYVARFGDSLQQIGANIGANGATPPSNITVMDVAFQCEQETDVFLVDQSVNCSFDNVVFQGPLTTTELSDVLQRGDIACVRYNSSSAVTCEQVNFDNCVFTKTTYGIATDEDVKGTSVTNSKFDTLYQGVWLGASSMLNDGATGFAVTHTIFDTIYEQGIYYQNVSRNASGYNIFYDVGNHFNGASNPSTSIIRFSADDNVSVGDMFEREDSYDETNPRTQVGSTDTNIIANSGQIQLGNAIKKPGYSMTMANNVSNQFITRFNDTTVQAATLDYTMTRDTIVRRGTMTIVKQNDDDSSLTLSVDEDYTENAPIGCTLTVFESGGYVNISYSTTDTSITGIIYYSLNYLA